MKSGLLDVSTIHILTVVNTTQSQCLVEVEARDTRVGHLRLVSTK